MCQLFSLKIPFFLLIPILSPAVQSKFAQFYCAKLHIILYINGRFRQKVKIITLFVKPKFQNFIVPLQLVKNWSRNSAAPQQLERAPLRSACTSFAVETK